MLAKADIDIESVLKKFSLWSPYYIKLFSLLLFAGCTNAMYSVQYVFITTDVEYRCKYLNTDVPTLNATFDMRLCTSGEVSNNSSNDTNELNGCNEWVYSNHETFFAEFDLGCQDWKRLFVATVHCAGYMIGLLIIGPLADKIGRKKLIIVTGLVAAFMGLGRSVVSSYWVYITLELIEAMFGDAYSSTYMLGVEMVTKENRVTFISLMTGSTALTGTLMAAIAWSVPYWRNFLRVIYAPALMFLFYFFLLDESLRWLLITGRKEEAQNIIKRAAKISNIQVPEVTSDNSVNVQRENETEKVTSMVKILKITLSSKKLVLRFGACVCMWTTGLFSKYTLLMNSVELEGNKYLNFGLMKLVELPASIALSIILKRFKRKIPLIYSFLFTGLFCVLQSFVPKGQIILSTSLFLLGKFMATISLEIIYLYTSELFPTYFRNTMHSLSSSLGRTATMLATQTLLLMQYWHGMPSLLIGVLSFATGVIVMMMPDTAEDVLPNTVEEAENVGYKGTGRRKEESDI